MASQPAKLMIVRRGKPGTFRMLNEFLKNAEDVQIIWDRRGEGDRRQGVGSAPAERHANDRRRPFDSSWNVLMPQAHNAWSVLLYAAMKAAHCQRRSGDDSTRRQA